MIKVNYCTKIKNPQIWGKVQKMAKIVVPEDFKTFFEKYNAGTPEECCVMINGVERVIGAFLSYNEDETDTDSAFLALEVLEGKKCLPLAIDPFGNYFCYSYESKVVFWNHEESKFDVTEMSLEDFVAKMYS